MIDLQDFVVRNDSPCGSTIGPIMSAKLGMPTVDIGGPQLSMHSIREMCCTSSVQHAIDLYTVSKLACTLYTRFFLAVSFLFRVPYESRTGDLLFANPPPRSIFHGSVLVCWLISKRSFGSDPPGLIDW